jgi:hypothetical protein
MMKKLLALVVVLSMAGMASAGYLITIPDEVVESTPFQIIIGGAKDGTAVGGTYGEVMPFEVVVFPAAGNLGSFNLYPEFGGVDFVAGDVKGAGVQAGDWVAMSYMGGPAGTFATFSFYDYDVSYDVPVETRTVSFIVPEPMTLTLLGLGALVLRRRS